MLNGLKLRMDVVYYESKAEKYEQIKEETFAFDEFISYSSESWMDHAHLGRPVSLLATLTEKQS